MLEDNTACGKAYPSFTKFMKDAKDKALSFDKCPSEDAVRNHLRSFGDPEERPSNNVSRASGSSEVNLRNCDTPQFCVSEFARLFIMMRDDHVCKQSLLQHTQDLKIADFEAGRTRESFWKEIEKRFNDPSLQYQQSFEGSVPEANPAALAYRTFEVLKSQLQNARQHFTLVYSNYCQSGQNDPAKWPDFLDRDPRTGEFKAGSKRSYIIFVACRLDQECGQDMFLLNASKKTFLGGDGESPGGEPSTGSSGTKRKRMRSDAFNSTMDKRWATMEGILEETKKQGEVIQQIITTKEGSLTNSFAYVAERTSVLQVLTNAYKSYNDAKGMGADPKLVGFLNSNYDSAMAKYSALESRSTGQ